MSLRELSVFSFYFQALIGLISAVFLTFLQMLKVLVLPDWLYFGGMLGIALYIATNVSAAARRAEEVRQQDNFEDRLVRHQE